MSRWVVTLFAVFAICAAVATSFGVARAQPAGAHAVPSPATPPVPAAGAPRVPARAVFPTPPTGAPGSTTPACADVTTPHGDIVQSSKNGMAILFWLFALVTVGGGIFVITRKNLIAAVMGMVGSFSGVAAVYMMLYANFLAVLQMLVYAGAIMVLFVFVIMILNRPEDEPLAPSGRAGRVIGVLAIVYLIARVGLLLWHVTPPNATVAMCAPAPTPDGYAWGSVRAVGMDLFGPGLFPFEAISILLLVAVVGAIAIARPLHEDSPSELNAGGPTSETGGHA
jgi:NADH-quinone oxidoreductase subunit J